MLVDVLLKTRDDRDSKGRLAVFSITVVYVLCQARFPAPGCVTAPVYREQNHSSVNVCDLNLSWSA